MKIAIIIARGGSKRIPRKNIRDFCGKPIIAYSIQAAQESGCFDEVMVSTEDREIAEVSLKWGAKVPFMRSDRNATDLTTTAEVLVEVLTEYQKININPQLACCLYPTAPFVTADFLNHSYQKMLDHPSANTVMPVVRFSYPIQRALRMQAGFMSMFNPEHISTRSQDLEPAYHDAGQCYWFRVNEFLRTNQLISGNTIGVELPEWQVQDIDNEADWVLAEMKYRFIQERKLKQTNVVA